MAVSLTATGKEIEVEEPLSTLDEETQIRRISKAVRRAVSTRYREWPRCCGKDVGVKIWIALHGKDYSRKGAIRCATCGKYF